MLQDLYPHIYHNEMAWKAPAPDDYALIFAPDGTVYCDLTDGALTLPRIRDVGPGEAQYAFSIDEAAYYLVAAHPDETDAFRYVPAASLRSMTERTSPALFAAAEDFSEMFPFSLTNKGKMGIIKRTTGSINER